MIPATGSRLLSTTTCFTRDSWLQEGERRGRRGREEREEREGGEGGEGGEEKGSALRPDNFNSHATNNSPNGSIRKKVSLVALS